MQNIVLFDPSYGTLNLGDEIINEAIMSEMAPVFDKGYLARFPTHTPILHSYQMLRPTNFERFCAEAEFKFLGGTNLIKTSLLGRKPDWNINILTARLYRDSIALGVGTGGSGRIKNAYTRNIYRNILSKDFTHSVRDRRTGKLFESLGVKAINTGCPTMWALTPEHCSTIPTGRAEKVVYTVTDYARDPSRDRETLNLLSRNYEQTFVWVQGAQDYAYLAELGILDSVTTLPPSVAAYRDFLDTNDVDYVGTRLHAGIYAMRRGRRAIIVAVDHRATDIQETHGIRVVPRGNITQLANLLTSEFATDVSIDVAAISEWKAQFHLGRGVDSQESVTRQERSGPVC